MAAKVAKSLAWYVCGLCTGFALAGAVAAYLRLQADMEEVRLRFRAMGEQMKGWGDTSSPTRSASSAASAATGKH